MVSDEAMSDSRTSGRERDEDDTTLMMAYATGDERAFAELYRRHAGRLRGWLRLRGASAADADDLLQQTFLRLHRHRAAYQRGLEVRPWLFTIARNLLRDHGRRRAAARVVTADVDAVAAALPSAADELDGRRSLEKVASALAQLPPSAREALELHWDGPDAIAAATERDGLSSSTLRVRAHRAQHALRRLLPELDDQRAA
jgi:RNA polymerase sigma-70 factor (ECF subfamily)